MNIQRNRFEWIDIVLAIQYDRLTVVLNLKSVVKLSPQISVNTNTTITTITIFINLLEEHYYE